MYTTESGVGSNSKHTNLRPPSIWDTRILQLSNKHRQPDYKRWEVEDVEMVFPRCTTGQQHLKRYVASSVTRDP